MKRCPPTSCLALAKATAHVNRLLISIRAAHDAGKRKKADQLVCRYLASFDARYLAVLEAYKRKGVQQDASLLPDVARSLNAWAGSDEEVLIRIRQKPGNPHRFRTILEFGVENYALQLLVREVLKAQADLHPNQYHLRGTHAAIERVVGLLKDGYAWATEIDIHNCYPSFDGEKVPDFLPIPKEVSRHVILGGTHRLLLHSGIFGPADKPGEDDELIASHLFADARQGLPQGSAASPLAVEMLFAPLLHKLPAGSPWTGYSDNFLAMGKTKADAVSMSTALWSALKAHPAGQFWPNPAKVYAPGEPIVFLGHRFQRLPGMTRIDPTPDNLGQFDHKMDIGLSAIKAASSKAVRMKRIWKLQGYVSSWTAAFKLCADISTIRHTALKRIAWAATMSEIHE